jgi:hypothetical protein
MDTAAAYRALFEVCAAGVAVWPVMVCDGVLLCVCDGVVLSAAQVARTAVRRWNREAAQRRPQLFFTTAQLEKHGIRTAHRPHSHVPYPIAPFP